MIQSPKSQNNNPKRRFKHKNKSFSKRNNPQDYEYSQKESAKFICEPMKEKELFGVQAIDNTLKQHGHKYPTELKELNEQRKELINKIKQAEKKLLFSHSTPLEEELMYLKRQDTKVLCQIIDLIA